MGEEYEKTVLYAIFAAAFVILSGSFVQAKQLQIKRARSKFMLQQRKNQRLSSNLKELF